ncbi:unnamed protein product [Durusdinium trenchii]|uniref:Uncharacterized protein n=1 Tax=Durusdinium trenchii TaxID=1381693 RepID=A0ABP0MWT8_9DINO
MDLTPEDHEALVMKIVSVYESDLETKGELAKLTMDQLWSYRMVVQAWRQTVIHCARADLGERSFREVQSAIESGDALDQQLCNCLKSFPLEFGLTMLPDVKCMTAASEMPDAEVNDVIEMAERDEWTSKFVSVGAKLKSDWKMLNSVSDGYEVLGDCLDWLSTQKKLKVAQHARETVDRHMQFFCPVLAVESNDSLPGDLEGLMAFLPALAHADGKCGQHCGVVFPNRSREDSECDPMEDEWDIVRKMREAGFKRQVPFFMPLRVPMEEAASQAQWDFGMRGRLAFWGNESVPNVFAQCSELVRTGKLPEGELSSETLPIISTAAETERADGMRVCAATWSAQKGGEVWKIVYQQLMMTSKANPAAAPPLVKPNDEITILDSHVHNGDHALGSCLMSAEGGPVQRHVMLKWLKHELKLFSENGSSVAPIEADVTILDETDKGYLRSVPGAMEAYEGTRTWEGKLRVTCLSGAQVSLLPSLKAEFSHAPPSVKVKFDEMEKLRNEKYGSILVGKLQSVRGDARGGTVNTDPRPVSTKGNDQEGDGESNPVKAFDNRGVGLLVAENGHAFIIVKSEDLILRKGTKLAGLGSGRMTQKLLAMPCNLFFLKVIIGNGSADEAEQKVQKGSFYIVVKELMKNHNLADIAVTGHTVSVCQPSAANGTHGFDIKVSTDAQQGKPWFFQPKDKEPASYTPGNAARNVVLMNDKVALHPAFSWLRRFGFDKAHSKLTAKKAFLVCNQDVSLKANKPIKLTPDSS